MPVWAVYEAESGRLVSWTQDAAKVAAPAVLTARGYAVAERPDSELGGAWNAATLAFDPPPAAEREITAYAFMLRFPEANRVAILNSADPVVVMFRTLLQTAAASGVPVDLDGQRTISGVQYLVSIGMLTEQQAAGVLA